MHSPLLFAHDANGALVDDLKTASDRQDVIDIFAGNGADVESLFERLEQIAGCDWTSGIGDGNHGWDAVELMKSLGAGVTFTPATEFYGWLEVTPQRCRELLDDALKLAIKWMQISRRLLAEGAQRVDVAYPSLGSGVGDDETNEELLKDIWSIEGTVRDYHLSGRSYVTGLLFVIVDEDELIRVQSFGQLVREAVSRGEGIRLAVAHCFTGDYHY